LVASGLLVRSFALISSAGVGFNPANLMVLELPFPRTYARNTGENTSAGGLRSSTHASPQIAKPSSNGCR
jgi:hypothetical protein